MGSSLDDTNIHTILPNNPCTTDTSDWTCVHCSVSSTCQYTAPCMVVTFNHFHYLI